ncbi:hypothetical protein ACVIWU_005003 [Bradyrhizobium sp. USDA 4509]
MAATRTANAQASGANFSPFAIDPLAPVPTNVLAPQEELPNLVTPVPPTGFVLGVAPPPTISGNPLSALIVDESFLTAATNHGVAGSGLGPAGATVASVQVSFNVTVPGGQQSLTYALSVTTPNEDSGLIDSATGQHVLLTVNAAGVVEGRTAISGDLVLTVSVDAAGHVTLTDLRAVHEATPGNFNEGITLASGLITLTATVTDNNSQSASASVDVGSHLTILDDGPAITMTATAPADALVVDETNLAINASANFADNFTVTSSYGADGAGTTASAYTLGIKSAGVDSGLIDVATGQHVYLYVNGNVVEGRVGAGGAADPAGVIDFTVSVSAAGVVTLDQVHALQHPNAANPDDVVTLSATDLITLTRTDTITDRDGDTTSGSASINIGQALSFHDDGPTLGTPTAAVAGQLTLDETNLTGAPISTSANFAGNFDGGTPHYGTDGPGHVDYALALSANGTGSGLYALDPADVTTADNDGIGQGSQILLYQLADGSIVGKVGAAADGSGGTLYFTISVAANGDVTFTQDKNIWHSNTGNNDELASLTTAANTLLLNQTVTDADGDHVTKGIDLGSGVFAIHDDGPSLGTPTAAVAGQLTLDETNLTGAPISTSANFAGNFDGGTPHYGTDGPGHVDYALALSANGTGSGLYALDPADVTTADNDGIGQGSQILLYQLADGSIVGKVGAAADGSGGTLYFTISVAANGDVTFTQDKNIWHSNTGNNDELASLTTAANTLLLNQTVTDADGDHVTKGIDLGSGVFAIHDDGPSLGTPTAAVAGQLTLDETNLTGAPISTSANFAGNFDGGTPHYGTDGPGHVDYALALSANGLGSGLYALDPADVTTADNDGIGQGSQILLYQLADGSIVGKVGAAADGSGGTLYFTISVAANGDVTFTQDKNIWHSNTGNNDELASLTTAANTLLLNQTVTDADGDHVTKGIDLGSGVFAIHDDGPSLGTPTAAVAGQLTLDETNLTGAPISTSANFAGNFDGGTPHYGTDGPGHVDYALALSANGLGSGLYALDPADVTTADNDGIGQGSQILLYQLADGSIVGKVGAAADGSGGTLYFTISVAANGDVTFTQDKNIWHSNTGNNDELASLTTAANTLLLNQTVTDADGDHVTKGIDLGSGVFAIHDDGPSLGTPTAAVAGQLTLDETNLTGAPISTSANFAGNFDGGTPHYGTDGPGHVDYALALSANGTGSGLYALDPADVTTADNDGIGQGSQILLYQLADGSIVGKVGAAADGSGGTLYFTISVAANGDVTFTQDKNIWHSNTGNNDELASLTTAANTLLLNQTVTDADGDHVTKGIDLGSGVFAIHDDGPSLGTPTAAVAGQLTLDETNLTGAPISTSANFAGNFDGGTPHYGTDGPGHVDYALALSANGLGSGLYALDPADVTTADNDGIGQGSQILLYQLADGSIVGKVGAAADGSGGTLYFTISVAANGDVTFTQDKNIWHSNTGNNDELASLTTAANTLLLNQTVTDADGDHVTKGIDLGSGVFAIHDDGPSLGTPTAAVAGQLTLDETNLTGAPISTSANFAGNFDGGTPHYGTDGPGHVDYALALSANGLGSGLYALDPADVTTADNDGIGQGSQILLYQLADGSIVGKVGAAADGSGGTLYFTISVAANGDVTFTQDKNIWHSNTGNNDELASLTTAANTLLLNQTVTDADGDHVTKGIDLGSGVFAIHDDGPSLGTPTAAVAGQLTLDETNLTGAPISTSANFAGNFDGGTPHYGTDGPGHVDYALALSANGLGSGLYALDPADVTTADNDGIGQGSQILLYQLADGSIVGKVGAAADGSGGTLYFTISVAANGDVTFTQDKNIWHSNTGNNDELASLTTAANTLLLNQTVTDADGDHVTKGIDLGSGVFAIHDDGPSLGTPTAAVAGQLTLDETNLTGAPISTSANFAGNFDGGTPHYGTDGPGHVDYALALSANGLGSGLYALDPADVTTADNDGIGQGSQILLYQLADGSIVGKVGAAADGSGGTLYFTISVAANGDVTFTQDKNIWHSNTGNNDELASLTTAANTLLLNQTVTDADGDHVTKGIDLGSGVFAIHDDGPSLGTPTAAVAGQLTLDETNLTGAPISTSANFAGNFDGGTPHYGTDGPGHVDYALALSANGTGSGLYALDPADVTTADNDGIGQGSQILLYQLADGSIVGKVGAAADGSGGTLYFTISVAANGDVTFTQDKNIWHSNTGNNDELASLTTAANTLLLNQTVTDADGDHVTKGIDLGSGVFAIHDDGPTAPTATVSAAKIGVDETPGAQTTGGASDVLGSTAITFNGAASTVAALFSTVANKGVDTDVSAASLDNGALSFASTGASSILTVAGGSFGSDGAGSTTYALSVLSAASGLTLTDGTGIALSLDASGRIIGTVGNDAANPSLTGQTAFAIAIDPITGQLYVADYLSLHHNSTASPNDLLTMTAGKIGATVTLTDADGDHVTATADISTHISFLDDGPSFGTIEHGIIADYAGMSVLGNLPVFSGADGFGAYDFTLTGNTAPAGLTFNGQAVHYSIDAFGQNLTAYIGAAPSAANNIFTLTLDDTTGHYLFTLLQPFTETTIQDVGSSSAFGSGPSQEQMLSSSTDQLAVISGTASGGAQGSVNGSTNGWGVGNNNFDPNEKLLFDFTDGASASPAGNAGFHPPAHESVANYTFSGYKAGDDIHYVVSYWDGVHAASITSVSGDFDPSTHTTVATEWSTPTAPAGLQLYTVQFTDVTGSGKVDLVGVGISSTKNVSEDLSFNVSTIDGDGDTASSTINININGTTTLLGTAGNDVIVAGPTNETLTGNGGDDKFVLNLSAHDIISDFNSGDTLLLDVAGLSLPTGVSNALTAGQFTSSAVTGQTENNASAWNESASTNKFFFNNTTQELWYSANGTGSDKVDLAHVSTGLPAATNVHIF